MIGRTSRFFCMILIISFLTTVVFAQQQTGNIVGKVTDSENTSLPGVVITAKSPALQGIRSAITDENGDFQLPLLPIGIYTLSFELPAFEKLTRAGYDVRLGFTIVADVIMKEARISEEIIVQVETPLIDKRNADNSYRLNDKDITYFPAQARTIEEVTTYTPGVTGVRTSSFKGTDTGYPSFRGQGEDGNRWLVDGLALNSAYNNSLNTNVNLDSWDEIQIISDGFSPDLGQTQGGFVNIITKSGGNEIHGELGVFLRDWHLRADRESQLSVVNVPNTSIHRYLGNLGGYFIKDKLWFFVSNNFNRTLDDFDEQNIGWLTIPAGNRRLNTNNLFAKLTFTPRINHTIMASGILDNYLNQNGGIGLPETHTAVDYTNLVFRVNYRGILSPNTLLTANIGRNSFGSDTMPLKDNHGDPRFYWLDIAQNTNNATSINTTRDKRTDLTVELTQYLDTRRWGNHELGIGLFYYQNRYKGIQEWTGSDYDPWEGNGFDNGLFITWSAPNHPVSMSEYAESQFTNASRGFGGYIQDRFTIGRFSLMLGLRTETQTVFDDLDQEIWSWGLDDFLSPRAALAIDLFNDGNNILKLSYGQFTRTVTAQTLMFFNSSMSISSRFYNWIGDSSPSDAQLKNPDNWTLVYEQSGAASAYQVDPDMKPNKTNKFLLEFDRQLGSHWAIKFRGIYSYSHNLLDTVAIYDPDSIYKYVFTNFELKKRDYKALEVELNGRITDKLMLNAAYTWSQDKGTYPGQRETYIWGGFWGGPYDITVFGWHPLLPDDHPAKGMIDSLFDGVGGRGIGDEGWYGYLPYAVDHQIKILGTYFAPYGINLAAGIEYLSGYHWEKRGLTEAFGFFLKFPEGRGSRTTPGHAYVDVLVQKDISLPKGILLGVGLNFYNLLNSQRPVSFIKEDTALFGEVWGRQLPRWLQLKLSIRF